MRELPILVADDDPHVLDIVRLQLQERGYAVNCASNKKQLLDSLYQQEPILLLLDIRFGDIDGVELMQEILRQRPHLCIVMFTAHASIENAVDAIRHGAFDYLTKPIDYNRIKVIIERAIEKRVLTKRLQKLEQLLSDESGVQPMLGNSPALARTRELIATAAATDATVLILGESGTGKELVARSLHEQSSRAHGPFIPVNMATLPQELVESILFGHQKGAFTGAFEARMGCCEAADKGTLFLDEISEMELGLQSKLLRFLQDRTFQRVGSPSTVRVDVRVVAASNRDLKASVAEGRFREDLYYRLHVIPIVVPPLRERREDIPLLAEYFIQRAAVRYRKELIGFTESAIERLTRYNWPGNVRQLENLVERVAILCRGPWIDAHELPDEVVDATSESGMVPERVSPGLLNAQLAADSDAGQPIDLLEKQAILNAMEQMRGNVQKVAKHLGLGQATVYRKIKRYGLDLHDWRRTSQIDKQPPN